MLNSAHKKSSYSHIFKFTRGKVPEKKTKLNTAFIKMSFIAVNTLQTDYFSLFFNDTRESHFKEKHQNDIRGVKK